MIEHIVGMSLLEWLRDKRRAVVPLNPADGSIRLDFGVAYRAVLLLFAVAATVMGGGLAYATWDDYVAIVVGGGVIGTMWLALLYGVYDAFFVTLKASALGLEALSPVTGLRVLPWESITRTSYAMYGNWYTFTSEWGWSIRVSIYRDGLESFAALVNSNIGRSPAGRTPKDFYKHTASR